MQMIIEFSVSHREECLYSAVALFYLMKKKNKKYAILYKANMKTTESHYVEKFLCKVFMVFMNSTNMSRFNVSLNQN